MNNTPSINTTNCVPVEGLINSDWLMVLTVLGSLMVLVSTTGNSIIIATYIKVRSLHKPSNVLLVSLVVGDMLYCIAGFPVYIVSDHLPELYCSRIYTKAKVFVLVLSINVSLSSLSAVAIERFIGVQFPYLYHRHISTMKCSGMAAVCWMTSFLRSLILGLCHLETCQRAVVVAEYSVDVVLMVCTLGIYCRVYQVSHRHLREDLKHGVRVRDSKCLATVMIAVVFLASWLPPAVVRGVQIYLADVGVLLRFTFLSPLVGTCFNLMIYTYRMQDFREAVKKLLRRNSVNETGSGSYVINRDIYIIQF